MVYRVKFNIEKVCTQMERQRDDLEAVVASSSSETSQRKCLEF